MKRKQKSPKKQFKLPLSPIYKMMVAIAAVLVGIGYIGAQYLLKPTATRAASTQLTITGARLETTSIGRNEDRVLLICGVSGCTTSSPLMDDVPFTCPKGKSECTVTVTMSTGHNCTENTILGNLQIDGVKIENKGGINEMRFCNPNDANGNFDNLSSYTWVYSGLQPGNHTANVLLTYIAGNGTGIAFDRQTLVVNVYSSN